MSSIFNEILSKYKEKINELQSTNDTTDLEREQPLNIISFLKKYDFKLPIESCSHRRLSSMVKGDLEMDGDVSKNIISNLTRSSSETNSKYDLLADKWSSIYSLDREFIKDNQRVLKKYKAYSSNMDEFIDRYSEFKQQKNFLSKFKYIQFNRLRSLNSISGFLQFLAIYNFCSPLLSLLTPILGLIMPYFVLYFKGIRISFSDYISMVKSIILNQYVIKGLLNFTKNSFQTNAYVISSLFFYFLSIYNNILSCLEFYQNVEFMIEFIDEYDTFLSNGTALIDNIYKYTGRKKSFASFNSTMLQHKDNISNMRTQLNSICGCSDKYLKYGNIGYMLKCNFELYHSQLFDETIGYLIYLNNYNIDLTNISNLLKTKKINICKFVKTEQKPKLTGGFYLPHIEMEPIRNNISTDSNILITGPNASGKTTLIKSTIINMFLSQSLGCGCYTKCKTQIYDYYHSYLNIPDTSNRDSLFQAEARQCKEIIMFIEKHKKKKHFCIFDEIYSGTNPNDAVLCATIYLKGLNKYKPNVDYLLTTHYTEMCEKFKDDSNVILQKMMVEIAVDKTFSYTYKLTDGISHINGGYQILEQLEYPKALLKV